MITAKIGPNDRPGTAKALLVTGITVLIGMTMYECLKQWVWPDISIWRSHILTISFSTVIATIIAATILNRYNALIDALLVEQAGRHEAEDELQKQNVRFKEEIEQRKKAELALRENELKYREFFITSRDCVFITSPDGHWLDFNDAAVEVFGYDSSESLSVVPIPQLYADPDDRGLFLDIVQRQGFVKEHPVKLKRKNGEVFDSLITSSCLRDADGSVRGFAGTIRDVTERRQAEGRLRESEERFRVIAEAISGVLWMADVEIETIFYVSPGYERVWGRSLVSLYENPRSFIDAIHEEDRDRVMATYKHKMTGQPFRHEYRIVRPDGEIRWISDRGFPVLDENGKVTRYGGIALDVTDRKKAEDVLRESEERFRRIFEQGPLGLAIVSLDYRWLAVNGTLCEMLGYSEDELVRLTFVDITHPDDLDMNLQYAEKLARGAIPFYRMEKRYIKKSGEIFWINITGSVVRDDQGKALYFLSMIEDISDRKKAEKALRESEERYRTLVENLNDIIYSVDCHGVITYVSPVLERRTKYTCPEVVGRTFTDFIHPDDATKAADRYLRVLRGEPAASEYRMVDKDGSVIHFTSNSRPVFRDGSLIGMTGLLTDISERKQAEQAVRDSEQRFRTIIESAPAAIAFSRALKIIYANPKYVEMFGYENAEDLLGLSITETVAPQFVSEVTRRALCREQGVPTESSYSFEGLRKDGARLPVQASVTRVNLEDGPATVAFFVDVTELKRAEEDSRRFQAQLLQAQKMEAIGTLAGGIAHDFNNLLQITLGYSELMLEGKTPTDSDYGDLMKIHQAARSGAELVRNLMTFSRKVEPNSRPLDLNHAVCEVERILGRTLPKMIDIRLELADDLERTNADPAQIQQIIMNLAVNAKDAIGEEGTLTIRTENAVLGEDYCKLKVDAEPGNYVLLSVSDTGQGMNTETVQHIFEPFYTTKELGRGTGLGLAIVYGIVRQHGGHIECHSEEGKGATFKVYLPVIQRLEEPVAEEVEIAPTSGTETVLLVDDEESFRELGARILTGQGYTVLQAKNGKEALNLYRTERDRISLVILDLIMPEMGGKECLRDLMAIDPQANILMASGNLADATVKEIIRMGAKGFLSKPFRMRELLGDVRRVLDEV